MIDEILAHGTTNPTIQRVQKAAWLKVVPTTRIPSNITSWNLGDGESSVLAMAVGETDVEVVLDDLQARRRAADLGLTVRGTVGIILLARRNSVIPAARPVIEELRRTGMYLTDELVKRLRALVGE